MTEKLAEMMMAEMTSEISNVVKKAVEEHPWDVLKIKNAVGSAIIDSAKRGGVTGINYTGSSLRIVFSNGPIRYIMLSEYNGEDYIDEIGGIHGGGTGIAPNGVFCGECSSKSCRGCSIAVHKKVVRE